MHLIRKQRYFICRSGDQAVAAMSLDIQEPGVALIETMAVLPRHQRLGIGTKCVAHAKCWAERNGCRQLMVESDVGYKAAPFYKRCGFQLLGYFDGIYGDRYARLAIDLTPGKS